MAYNIKLEAFEGPFDLLFHLIEKAEVDIYNIPIAQITEQYIQYIEEMKNFDLEVTSEFLVMAATLLEIKSKMLIPNKQEEQLAMTMEEMDPRQELITRLIEYKKYKSAAIEFKTREEAFKKVLYKPQEQIEQYIQNEDNEVTNLELDDLLTALQNLLMKRKHKEHKRILINEIPRDEITIEQKIYEIKMILNKYESLNFQDLFPENYGRKEIVTTFLALLELIKQNFLAVQQVKVFGDIMVKKAQSYNEV